MCWQSNDHLLYLCNKWPVTTPKSWHSWNGLFNIDNCPYPIIQGPHFKIQISTKYVNIFGREAADLNHATITMYYYITSSVFVVTTQWSVSHIYTPHGLHCTRSPQDPQWSLPVWHDPAVSPPLCNMSPSRCLASLYQHECKHHPMTLVLTSIINTPMPRSHSSTKTRSHSSCKT